MVLSNDVLSVNIGLGGIPSIIISCGCCKKGLVSSPSTNQPTNGKRTNMACCKECYDIIPCDIVRMMLLSCYIEFHVT